MSLWMASLTAIPFWQPWGLDLHNVHAFQRCVGEPIAIPGRRSASSARLNPAPASGQSDAGIAKTVHHLNRLTALVRPRPRADLVANPAEDIAEAEINAVQEQVSAGRN
ncbi:MAG TPA: hypothetical protein VIF57_05255 [Polyangia bacterium]|jgi:hypothetical protein